MSTCVSRHGEFGSHTLDDAYTCTLCGVLDEDAMTAELRQLRARLAEVEAERDRLRRDFNTLTLDSDKWLNERQLAEGEAKAAREERNNLAAENARLRQDADDWARAKRWYELKAELDAMRPVVEAAEAWRAFVVGTGARAKLNDALKAAVDAYRAAQKAPLDRPGSPVGQDQAEVIPQWERDFLEAQAAREERDEEEVLIAMQSFDAHERNEPPADPPGLDAAIEDALAENPRHRMTIPTTFGQDYEDTEESAKSWSCSCGASGRRHPMRHITEVELRAAAPALRAGALRDAADEFEAANFTDNDAWSVDVAAWLRERADRIGGATDGA